MCFLLAAIVALLPACALPQELGYKNLVGLELRYAKDNTGVGGGSCGGAGHEPPPRIKLEITLLSLDESHCLLGDDMILDIKVLNVGKEAVMLPWYPHTADFEKRADGQDYRYASISTGLEISDDHGKGQIWAFNLYGSTEVAGSLLELKPGNWVQVRAETRLATNSDDEFWRRLVSTPESELTVKAYLFAGTITVTHDQGKSKMMSECVKWEVTSRGQESIRVAPKILMNPSN